MKAARQKDARCWACRQASPLEERGQDTGCSCGGGAGTLGVLLWGRGQDTGGTPVGGALTYTPQGGS